MFFIDVKLMAGDELRLHYSGGEKEWSGVGHVLKIPDSIISYSFHELKNLLQETFLFFRSW